MQEINPLTSKSLCQQLGLKKGLELTQVVQLFSSLPEGTRVCSFEDTVKLFTKGIYKTTAEKIEDCAHHLRCLMLNQFSDSEAHSIREAISNGYGAHVKAGNKMIPVTVDINKKVLRIIDKGTGIEDLSTLLVPGKTSNEGVLFSKGDLEIPSRWGQGFFSLFFYLTNHWRDKPKAYYLKREGCKKVFIPFKKSGCLYVAIFRKVSENLLFGPKIILHPQMSEMRNMVVTTCNPSGPIKIKFWEEMGKIFVDFEPGKKTTRGTKIKIHSPLLKNAKQISQKVSSLHEFVPTPLRLNGILLNQEKLKRLPCNEMEIIYTEELTNKGGFIALCEGGRKVHDIFLPQGIFFPKKIALSFTFLPLCHERESIDWKDQKTQWLILKSFNTLFPSQLPFEIKIAIFNSFDSLFKEGRFETRHGLIRFSEQLEKLLVSRGCSVLPDSKGMRRMDVDRAVYFHPNYLKTLKGLFFSTSHFYFYSVNAKSGLLASVHTNEKTNIFVDKGLINKNCIFNSELIKQWFELIHNKKLKDSVLISFEKPNAPKNSEKISSVPIEEDEMENYSKEEAIEEIKNKFPELWNDPEYNTIIINSFNNIFSTFDTFREYLPS